MMPVKLSDRLACNPDVKAGMLTTMQWNGLKWTSVTCVVGNAPLYSYERCFESVCDQRWLKDNPVIHSCSRSGSAGEAVARC